MKLDPKSDEAKPFEAIRLKNIELTEQVRARRRGREETEDSKSSRRSRARE